MFRAVTKVVAEKEAEASRAENDRQQDERELQTAEPKEHLSGSGRLQPLLSVRLWMVVAVSMSLAVQLGPPASENEVDRGCTDDPLIRKRKRRRVEQEWPRLRPAEAAVERDQFLERAALVEHWVVEAADHDVGDVREPVRAEQVLWRGRREAGERVLSFDSPSGEVMRSGRAEHDRPIVFRPHE